LVWRKRGAMHWASVQLLPEEDGQWLNAGNNLADALDAQGKYAEAETMYLEVLAVQRRVLGPEHPSTLRTSSNLGNTLMHRGKSAQAETIFLELIS
jgi:tetratricopeptide (TPR) repeat protein